MSNPALSRFWTNFSLHSASCAFRRSDLLFSSVGAASTSSPVTSLFPFPRRFLRERISHTSTKSKPRPAIKKHKWRTDSVIHQWACDTSIQCKLQMLPTDFGSSISEVIPQLGNCLVTSCVTVNIHGIITIHIFISSSGWKLKAFKQLSYYQNMLIKNKWKLLAKTFPTHFPVCKFFVLYMDS